MAQTNSLAWPRMLDPTRNQVAVIEDTKSLVSRTRLLILSEPTSLYNSPNFGVGLKRHLWQYNNENEKAIIRDRIVDSLRINEPCVQPDSTQFADGLLFTGSNDDSVDQDFNQLKMTVAIVTNYQDTVEVDLNDEIK